MKTKLAALTAVASLALAGCSAGNETADTTPAPVVAKHAAADNTAVEYRGKTAALETWVATEHAKWSEFYENQKGIGSTNSIFVATENLGGKWIRTIEWYAPSEGEIEVTVEGSDWTEKDLRMISGYVFGILNRDDSGDFSSEITSVRTFSENRSVSALETAS